MRSMRASQKAANACAAAITGAYIATIAMAAG
jgi:hypothetical protein